jgi:hypothetical protein
MKALMIAVLAILILCPCAVLSAQAPQWQWGSLLQSWIGELCSMATDPAGNTFITGYFRNTVNLGSLSLYSEHNNLLVAKMDTNGNWLWAKKAIPTGTATCRALNLTIDQSGNIYVTGYRHGIITLGTTTLPYLGVYDLFVAKLDTDGNWLWASSPTDGGDSWSYGKNIALDPSGNVYITGSFSGSATFGPSTINSETWYEDVFIAKLDSNGNWLLAKTTTASGTGNSSYGYAIGADSTQNIYVCGYIYTSVTFGATTLTCDGYNELFFAKLDAAGNWLWVKKGDLDVGGGSDYEIDMALDSSANVYVCAPYDLSVSFGALGLSALDCSDFLVKLDTNGNFLWAQQYGEGEYHDWDIDVALDAPGNIYLTSYFTGSLTLGSQTLTTQEGWYHILVGKMDSNGNWLWAKTTTDSSEDGGGFISLDAAGNVYVMGTFWGDIVLGDTTLTDISYSYPFFFAKLIPSGEVKPNPPQNLTLSETDADMLLDWDAVTHNTAGQTITVSLYKVLLSPAPDGDFALLDETTGTAYLHLGGANLPCGFYRIVAVEE